MGMNEGHHITLNGLTLNVNFTTEINSEIKESSKAFRC